MRPKEISKKSSELMYLNKEADSETSAYNSVLNALNKLDTSYNSTMQKMKDPVIEGNYRVTGDTRVIPILRHKDDETHWACSTSISMDAVELENLKEAMRRTNGYLLKMSDILEVNNFPSGKA